MPPSLTWAHYGADGGDLVTAVVRGRLPHPPGFPMYLLLGTAFVQLPWDDPAWRLNLMSAVMAAGAATLTMCAIRHTQSGLPTPLPALCAGLSLGLAPLFWSQALIAEVYAPAAFFSAAVLFLALRRAPAWLLGMVWGLGIGIHPTLLFLAPVVLIRAAETAPFRVHLRPVLFASLATAALYGPVLLTRGSAPSPWADLSTPAGWWEYVGGRLYRGYLFALPVADWPRRLLAWAGLMARQFTPLGALLALWGWGRLWRQQRPLAVATVLTFGGFSLYAVGYNTADSLVYLVPALPLAALWLGVGLSDLFRTPRSVLWPVCLLLPILQAVWGWPTMDVHRNRSAVTWATETLRAAPTDAVLLTAQDGATFTLWYVQDVLEERPDVRIVDRDLLGYEPYRRFLAPESGRTPEELFSGRPVLTVTAPLEVHP